MQDLENDMEDLFKRAGENYSPQTGKSEWENIAKRIAGMREARAITNPAKHDRKKLMIWPFLWLFFLSAGLFIVNNSSTKKGGLTNRNEMQKRAKISLVKTEVKAYRDAVNSKIKGTPFLAAKREGIRVTIKTTAAPPHTLAEKTTVISSPKYSKNDVQVSHNERARKALDFERIHTDDLFSPPLSGRENAINEILENLDCTARNPAWLNRGNILLSVGNISLPVKKTNNSVTPEKRKSLYFGLIAAPDFSKVQPGSFHNTGFDAGLLVGFRINAKFSFETGVILNKKLYTSKGKNFNMDKIGSSMPAGMIINYLESQSSVKEIPLQAKYDFSQKRNTDLFIAAGVSSYIMTMEKNKYNVTMNGNAEKISGVYTKNNYGLPAVVNIGIGYERNFPGNFNIRIEPFLKIPLQGMGVGSLPLTSTGLQIGFTRRLK